MDRMEAYKVGISDDEYSQFCILDRDNRPLAISFRSRDDANSVCQELNLAYTAGRLSLARRMQGILTGGTKWVETPEGLEQV